MKRNNIAIVADGCNLVRQDTLKIYPTLIIIETVFRKYGDIVAKYLFTDPHSYVDKALYEEFGYRLGNKGNEISADFEINEKIRELSDEMSIDAIVLGSGDHEIIDTLMDARKKGKIIYVAAHKDSLSIKDIERVGKEFSYPITQDDIDAYLDFIDKIKTRETNKRIGTPFEDLEEIKFQ